MANPTTSARRVLVPLPVALRINGGVYAVAGVVLLAATWTSLYEGLDSSRPAPWIYAQLAGAALVALAFLCAMAATRNGDAQRLVAGAAAAFNGIGFVCVSVWLFSDDRGIPSSGTLGSWVFDVFAVVILVLGIIEGLACLRAARRS